MELLTNLDELLGAKREWWQLLDVVAHVHDLHDGGERTVDLLVQVIYV